MLISKAMMLVFLVWHHVLNVFLPLVVFLVRLVSCLDILVYPHVLIITMKIRTMVYVLCAKIIVKLVLHYFLVLVVYLEPICLGQVV